MNQKKYITIVNFTAFDRELKECFVDAEPIMMYNLRRRISLICNTYRIHRIETYEGTLVNTEVFNHDKVINAKLETMKNEYK